MTKPTPIKLGVALLCASVVVNALAMMLHIVPHPSQLLGALLSKYAVSLLGSTIWPSVLPIFLIVMIWYRKNWARFVFLALVVIGVISLAFLPSKSQVFYWLLGLGLLLQGIGLAFLFAPAGSAWFRKQLEQ